MAFASPRNPIYGVEVDHQSLIDLRLDARLLKLDLSKGARSILAGQHHSRFRGRGMDYAESRHYQPGDDARSIDWRVTARTGQTHTKVYIEERERPVFILGDFSASLFFGTKDSFKSVLAARAAALLAWTAVQNGDRLGGVLQVDNRIIDLKPKAGRRGALAMVNALVRATRQTNTRFAGSRLNPALQHLNVVVHPGSLVLIFSDFCKIDRQTHQYLSSIRQHNDLVACQVLDPIEINPPGSGRYPITDGASAEQTAVIDTTLKTTRRKYREYFTRQQAQLRELALSLKIPVFHLVNGDNPTRVVAEVFGKQSRAPAGHGG
ncbi:MAG: DUF58 domain-containing protein [Gammaproteobacteria bacterium]|nr:DUF58 domain-containing protein [Gammaproteobacteria bacterium]